ncbi:mannose-binding protein [Streptomyces anulatus]|uniref:mannose-binding protein n=1 Tax=Streptomyces anulatus TaxID=1892 RepID=UPI001C60134B|nr:mannose-binding protein [Streptomyces anulatus]QYA92788.1 mannose-binding protein [Streptomyces anulatus]
MPPEPPAPGTESAAAEKSGSASPPSAAPAEERKPRSEAAATAGTEESPAPAGAPAEATAGTGKTRTEPAATARTEETRAPAGAAAGAGDPPTATAPSDPSTGGTTEAPEGRTEGIALATAVAAKPGTKTLTVADRGRPRTPVLAGAVFVGAALVAIPVLLMGSANDEKPRHTGTAPVAGSGDTVLNAESAPAALDDYVAVKPTPSPTEQKKTAAPKVVPAPVVPTPAPRTSAPAEKPKASPKPKPKAAPKPNWGTQTVSATSSIGVGQSWATNRIRMTMQQDGNLVVYNEQNKPIWAAMTFGENHRAIFQPDGNLVVHNGDDRAIWASKTHDFGGARLVLRPDAKVVVVHNGRVVWST